MSFQLVAILPTETAIGVQASLALFEGGELVRDQGSGLSALFIPAQKKKRFQSSRKATIRAMVDFQQALEKAQSFGALLPGLYGSTLETPQDMAAIIRANEAELAANMAEYGLMRQFQLTLSWPTEEVLRIAKDKHGPLPQAGSKTELAHQVANLLEEARRDTLAQLKAALFGLRHEITEFPIESSEIGLNAMILFNGAEEPLFDQAIEKLDSALGYDARIALKGPLPACSFASVKFEAMDKAAFVSAQEHLGLAGSSNAEDIEKAFKAAIKATHPDLVKSDSHDQSEADLAGYKAARDYLLTCLKAMDAGADHLISFVTDQETRG